MMTAYPLNRGARKLDGKSHRSSWERGEGTFRRRKALRGTGGGKKGWYGLLFSSLEMKDKS